MIMALPLPRLVLFSVLSLILPGCLATGGAVREIVTTPNGAQITIEGFGACMSPCTVKLDRPRRVKIAKAGYVSITMVIEPGRGPINIPLKLAAATDDVATDALPDL